MEMWEDETTSPATLSMLAGLKSAVVGVQYDIDHRDAPISRSSWLGSRLVVQYSLPSDARASATLFSIDGKSIAVCADRQEKAGLHTITWDANATAAAGPLSPGMYLIRMKFGDETETQKVMLTK